MRLLSILILIGAAVLVGAGIWFFSYGCQSDWCLVGEGQKIQATNSYQQCVARGFPVSTAANPWICTAGDKFFIEGPK